MGSRGVNRSLYSAIFDDPDFQALPPTARHVLLTARLCPQAGPGVIFTCYPEVLARQTGLLARQVKGALKALEGAGWIQREGLILWVVNGLRYDPTMHLSDVKHQKAVARSVAALPRLEIVLRFCDYYGIVRPFDGPSKHETTLALPKTEDRVPKTEDRVPKTEDRRGGHVVLSDDQWLDSLRANKAYQHIDLDIELAKMDAWLTTPRARGRKKTRRFVVNWLNRVETQMSPKRLPDRTTDGKLRPLSERPEDFRDGAYDHHE
mgnify:FL=1